MVTWRPRSGRTLNLSCIFFIKWNGSVKRAVFKLYGRASIQRLVFTACVIVGISACAESFNAKDLEEKYADASSQFIELDGNRIHYRDEGEGEAIVLLHGTASSLHTWDSWAQQLSKTHRVIRMDLPGFGLTGPDFLNRYQVNDDVVFLYAFLQKLALKKVHIAGSSLGGRIAWQYALEHPDQVETLTLLNALGYEQESWPPPIQLAQWPVFDTMMTHVSPRFMYDLGLKDVYFDPQRVNDTLVDRYFELSRYPGNLAAFPKRVKARLDRDSHLIKAVRVPTLILWGEEDRYFPVSSAHRFHSDIRQSTLRVYEQVGHLPMEEVPEASVNDFTEFLALATTD